MLPFTVHWRTEGVLSEPRIQREFWKHQFEPFAKCDCYPSYDSNFHADGVKSCNFYEHANCVASFINKDDFENDTECLPSCDHTSIHQESIQYTRMDDGLTDYFRTVAAKSIKSTTDMSFLALGEFSQSACLLVDTDSQSKLKNSYQLQQNFGRLKKQKLFMKKIQIIQEVL